MNSSSVFISYAHRDTSVARVAGFTRFLHDCLPSKITLLLDRKYLGIGKNIADYVKRLETCPAVVVILTPEYKRRAESATGGVFPEYEIIRNRIHDPNDDFLILPVLFEGTSNTSIPETFIDEIYKDFTTFHPRQTPDEPPTFYLPEHLREEFMPQFVNLASAIESRISVRSVLPDDVLMRQLELLFAKTKITRSWISKHPEFARHLFVSTLPYNRIKSQDALFLIGRKGSGKSTIANILPELERAIYKTCIPIIADDINLLSTYEFMDEDRLSQSAESLSQRIGEKRGEYTQLNPIQLLLKYSWLGLFYICLAKQLCTVARDGELNKAQQKYRKDLEDEFDKFTFRQAGDVEASTYFTTASVSFCEFWDKIVESSLNQTNFADVVRFLDSQVNPQNYLKHLLSTSLLTSIRNVVSHCDQRALITLDDFDSVFSLFREGVTRRSRTTLRNTAPQALEASWIQALILLVLELKGYRKGWRDEVFDRIDFCITIPRDSYLQVLHSDRDAYFELECTADLEWTGIYLAKMLLRRLCYMYDESPDDQADVFSELERVTRTYVPKLPQVLKFDFNGQHVSIDIFCYVLRHTFWRPRDLLTYYASLMTACLSLSANDKLTVEQVRLIIGSTTKRILQFEFIQEFGGTIKNLDKIMSLFRRAPQIMTYSDCYQRVNDTPFEIAPAAHVEDFHEKLRILYEIGFLGLHLSQEIYQDEGLTSNECFYFNEGSGIFDSMAKYKFEDCKFLLHPCFVETLRLQHSAGPLVLNWHHQYLRNNHVVRNSGLDAS